MKILAIGASRNSGQTKLVKGDALVDDDLRTAWIEANADDVPVDTVLLTFDSTQIVAIRSNGVTADSHKSIPCLTNGFYALISVPHVDKLGMEKITHWSARWSEGSWKDGEPEVHILLQDWEARYKAGEEIPDL
ncbi:hypothetical protein M407DRAFT_219801 [Tulasnella calospora MUT 4182]|uniref:Uncharacterized protein n=1 Tax=Tulasnella calospora MUT 4182 TaxID=1051891 RepID=A0A0C3MCG1_9AGAM|nr:hypothetical protein M407DRAFT_219801 [Tulasnella calospora MUT 4182]